MGLDIYLYTREQAERNAAYEKASNEVFEDGPDGKSRWDAMSETERDAWRAENDYSCSITVPSEKYPDHLFNRRYLRSSYNGGGFNRAGPHLIGAGHGAYWIFEPMGREWDGDEGTLTADDIDKLRASKARALEVAESLRNCDRLRVLSVSPNMFGQPPRHTDDEALRMYRQKVADGQIKPDGWWSSAEMDVFGDGLTILAAIPGAATFGVPGVHLIYRAADEGFDSYVQSAEIVAEFCDEAISLIERDGSCSMSWSG